MAEFRSVGLAAALLAASGGLALATWGFVTRRWQADTPEPGLKDNPEHGRTNNLEPIREEHQEPIREEHQEPIRGEHQEPIRGEHQEPIRGEHQEPIRGEHQEPIRGEHQEPIRGEHQEPIRGEDQEPIRGEHQEPIRGEHQEHIRGEHQEPIRGEHQEPIRGEHQEPIRGEHQEPGRSVTPDAGREDTPEAGDAVESERLIVKDTADKSCVSAATAQQQETPRPCKQVLVLGLDGSGKTSVLNSILTNRGKQDTMPTEGINAMCINTGGSRMELVEIGGSETLRPYWKKYLPRALAVMFVVDSADHSRLPLAKSHLHQLIQQDSCLPLLVLANKQDLDNAYHITEIHEALALSEICEERKLFLIGTHAVIDGSEISSGIEDAREYLAQLISENTAVTV